MKKRMMVLLVAILILSLCSCGRSEPADETAEVSLSPAPIEETEQVEETVSNNENAELTSEESLDNSRTTSEPSGEESAEKKKQESHSLKIINKTIYEDENDTWIQNEDGVVIASFSNGDFDAIITCDDGYFGLVRDCSDFYSSGFEIGIISIDGDWVVDYFAPTDLTNDCIFDVLRRVREGDSTHIYLEDKYCKNWLEYCGEGVFCYECEPCIIDNRGTRSYHFLSVTTQSDFVVKDVGTVNTYWRGGDFSSERPYIAIDRYLSTVIVGLDGIICDLGSGVKNIGQYADGGFVYYQEGKLKFYDCATGQSSSICRDSERITISSVSVYKFENGQLDITLNGSDGRTYYATVDKQGNYITEPHL